MQKLPSWIRRGRDSRVGYCYRLYEFLVRTRLRLENSHRPGVEAVLNSTLLLSGAALTVATSKVREFDYIANLEHCSLT